MADVPHRAFPLRRSDTGGFEQVEQGSLDDVRQCVGVILRTPIGARPLAPAVGVDDPTFTAGTDADQLKAVIESDTNEPRAEVTVDVTEVDGTGEQLVTVAVALADDAEQLDSEVI